MKDKWWGYKFNFAIKDFKRNQIIKREDIKNNCPSRIGCVLDCNGVYFDSENNIAIEKEKL